MPFQVTAKALQRLEWPQLLERLRGHAATPRGRARCAPPGEEDASVDPGGLFQPDLDSAQARLAETGEARALLDAGEAPPLGGMADLDPALRRLARGGTLAATELLDLAAALGVVHATARHLARRAEEAPRLATLASRLGDQRELEDDVSAAIDPEGAVRDAASPVLAAARGESRRIAAELQRRLGEMLRDPDLAPHLSDRFVTVRNDRYVLPLRSDARGRLRGIVHDASASGTTLFVEPEALVELNNRMKQAELEIERETARVLRELSARAAAARPAIEAGLDALAEIDLACARGQLSLETAGVEPRVRRDGVWWLPQLRHPLLPPETVVPNDLRLGETFHVLVLSGPNAGGKTVAMKALALAALSVRAGLHVCAAKGAQADLVDALLVDIGDEQDLRESLSTFSAHMANLARIVDAASERALVVVDEIGVGTDPGEGAALAQAVLETLADAGARVVVTTHFNLLKEMAAVDPRFANACVEFDPTTGAPSYRLRLGVAGSSSAAAVAARMGLRGDVLARADALLEREDRRLDRLLAELSASRATLETERREAERLRAESESAREEYRARLLDLQARRDKLFRSMRDDLERSFRDAHTEVSAVIRDLQRGGTARDAAHARARLDALQEQARAAAEAAAPAVPEEPLPPVDWRRVRPGDPVRMRGGGGGVVLSLPDRRGRVELQVGAARLVLPAERLAAAEPQRAPARREARVSLQPALAPAGAGDGADLERCDLRGLRVEEALGRVAAALDRALGAGRSRVTFVHGLGTGALRDAVRRHLRECPFVSGFEPGPAEAGGDGLTVARLD